MALPLGDDPVVSAQDTSIRYRTRDSRAHVLAVDGVSFDIPRGQILALMGESGSGKSALAAAVALASARDTHGRGIPEICGGALSVFGVNLRRIGARRRDKLTAKVGYLPQDGADRLKPFLTVGENIAEPIFTRSRRFDSREATSLVATMVDAVRLPLSDISLMPYELSRGQRQRVALARALILDPELLVADEPTSGIDVTVRSSVFDMIRELHSIRSFSALVVSNDPVIAHLTRHVAVLRRGIIVGIGPIDELRAGPCAAYLPDVA